MRSRSYQYSSYAQQTSPRRRIAALAAAIVADVLLVLLLLRVAPPFQGPPGKPDVATFHLLPDAANKSTDATAAKAKHSGGAVSRKTSAHTAPAAATPPALTHWPMNMVTLSRDEYAASDIAKLPSHSDDQPQQSADASGSGAGDSASEPGQGPNGEPLYRVEWYRRPTDAELRTYLPHTDPGSGWGLIECQTVERFHVDNCRELGDSPLGSGYARAVREAAWQFLVRPPRRGGQSLVGAWVGIRIDYGLIAAAKK